MPNVSMAAATAKLTSVKVFQAPVWGICGVMVRSPEEGSKGKRCGAGQAPALRRSSTARGSVRGRP